MIKLRETENAAAGNAAATVPVTTNYQRLPEGMGAKTEDYAYNANSIGKTLDVTQKNMESAKKDFDDAQQTMIYLQEIAQMMKKAYEQNPNKYNYDRYAKACEKCDLQVDAMDQTQHKYEETVTIYKQTYDSYVEAAKTHDDYVAEQKKIYDTWRGSIRDSSTVQADLDNIGSQIDAYRQNDAQDAAGGLQGLLDTQALLEEELDWSDYFANSEAMDAVYQKQNETGKTLEQNYIDATTAYDKALAEHMDAQFTTEAEALASEKNLDMLYKAAQDAHAAYEDWKLSGQDQDGEQSYYGDKATVAALRMMIREMEKEAAGKEYKTEEELLAAEEEINRLYDAYQMAWGAYEDNPSEENRKAYEEAKAAYESFSYTHDGKQALDIRRLRMEYDYRNELLKIREMDKASQAALKDYALYHMDDRRIGDHPLLVYLKGKGYTGDQIKRYAETWRRYENELAMKRTEASAGRAAQTPILGTVQSWISQALGGITGTLESLDQGVKVATGYQRYVDTNAAGYRVGAWASAVQQNVLEKIQNNQNAPQWLNDVAGDGYQALNTLVNTLADVGMGAMTGSAGVTKALFFMGAAQQTFREKSAAGVDVGSAALMGMVSGSLELLTEKYSLDNLLKLKNVPGWKNALKNVAAQAAVEVSEEEASFLGNLLAEAVILGENSDLNRRIRELQESGMSEAQAKEQAHKELWEEASHTAIIAAMSGGAMAGGKMAVDKIQNHGAKQTYTDAELKGLIEKALAEAGRVELVKKYKKSKINQSILHLIDRVKQGLASDGEKVQLNTVSEDSAARIQELLGIDVRGYKVVLEAKQVNHILKDHGENGTADRSMADAVDIAKMEYALENPDSIEKAGSTRAYVTNKNGKMKPADTVLYERRNGDGSYYVVQAVPDTNKKTLYVVTAFIGKSGYKNTEAPQSTNANSPGATPEAESVEASYEDVTQAPAEGQMTNHETNAQSALASPSSRTIIEPGSSNVNTENQNGGSQNVNNGQSTIANSAAGTGLLYGSGQRDAGTSAGESDGGLGGIAERPAQRAKANTGASRVKAAVARQNLARSLRLAKVSASDIGLENGTESKNLQVLPQENWDEELQALAQKIQEETGKETVFVVGEIYIRGKSKKTHRARAAITDSRVILQADYSRVSLNQLLDHELYHHKKDIARGDGYDLNRRIEEQIRDTFSEEEFREVLDAYIAALDEQFGLSEAQTWGEKEAIMQKIKEEIFADAYAGINAFGAGADRFTQTVKKRLEQLHLEKTAAQENGTAEPTGPPIAANENTAEYGGERYSVSETFPDELQKWFDNTTHEERKVSGKRFLVGSTTDVLREIGVRDYEFYFGGAKIDRILSENASMSLETIKKAVMLLENPILIMDSLTVEGSIVLFGEVYTSGNKPVMISVLLNPKTKSGEILDYAVITSAYGRRTSNLQHMIDNATIYYICADKNRTDKWLQALGLQLPSAVTKYGSINTIPNGESAVKKINSKDFDKDTASNERYSVDDSGDEQQTLLDEDTYQRIKAEKTAKIAQWDEMFLEDRLGAEGAKQYKATQRAEESRKKKERADKRTKDRQNREKEKMAAANRATEAKRILEKKLLDMFHIPAGSRAELRGQISHIADRIVKNGALTDLEREMFFRRMYEAGMMTISAKGSYVENRRYAKDSKIYVPASVVAELGDDWNDLRRRAFRAGIFLTQTSETRYGQGAATIDEWNSELAEDMPELFEAEDADRVSALEKIIRMAEDAMGDQLSLGEYVARSMQDESISERDVLDTMERQMMWALKTFAETARVEIKLKDRNTRQVLKERQENREAAQRAKERKELRELQQKTLKSLQWLHKNRHRAPEELRAVFDEVLGDIDVYAVGAANEMRWSDKYGATWENLKQMYKEAQANDPNFMPSEDLQRIVDRLDNEKIGDMDISALTDLYKAAVGLRTEFYNRNNVINDEMNRMFAEIYTDSKAEIGQVKKGFVGKALDKLFNAEQLTPMNVLQRMAGWNPNSTFFSMAKQLEEGERKVRAFKVKANKLLADFLTEHEAWVKRADGQGKNAVWYKLEVPELMELGMGDKPVFGDTVTVYMTPAQKVHLYLESKNQDNLRHMMGGRTFVDKDLYSDGKRKEAFAQGKTIRLAPETVKQIVSDLTAEEQELAQILDRYYNSYSSQEINRVSNVLNGFDKAMGSFYAPIYTNQNYVKGEIGTEDRTAEGAGSLKERQHAANPSYNISAFEAFEKHADETATYVGMAIPARNWNSLLNWQEKGNSMGDVITHKWGDEAKKYITDLVDNLQSEKQEESNIISDVTDKMKGFYINAKFGLNPGIVLKQYGSIPLAGTFLGNANIPTAAQIKNIDKNLISTYTQELDWRGMGYSTPETKFLKDNPNWAQTNKATRFAFGGGAITASDSRAASVLWPWAENKVRREHPDLEIGTQQQVEAGESPFYKKVAEEFNNAVSRSQSVSDIAHQSKIRRSSKHMAKMFTMFKSDSAQAYNALRQSIGEAQYYKKAGADKETIRMANRKVGTTVLAITSNFAWAGVVNFLMNLWKQRGKKYRDEEGNLTLQSFGEVFIEEFLQSSAGLFVGGEELAEMIGSSITGDRYYGVESVEMSVIGDLANTINECGSGLRDIIADAADVLGNGGDFGEYLHRRGNDILGEIKGAASTLSELFTGVPTKNIEAYLMGLFKNAIPGFDALYEDMFATPEKGGLKDLEGADLTVRVGNILENRRASESAETAEVIAGLYAAGFAEAVPTDTPANVTVGGEEKTLGAYQQQVFDSVWSDVVRDTMDELVASEEFQSVTGEKQAMMLKTLYAYAAEQAKAVLFDDFEPGSTTKNIDAFKESGLSVIDYLVMNAEGLKAKDVLEYVDAGISFDDAMGVLGEIKDLEPIDGAEKVADVQRWRTCIDYFGNPQWQLSALGTEMTDEQYAKVNLAYDFGVDPEEYIKYHEIRAQFDENGNKSYSSAEVKAALDSMKLDTDEKAAMWQIVTGSKSAKNNPYSTRIGQLVLEAKASK